MDDAGPGFDSPLAIDYTRPAWLTPLLAFTHLGALACLFASGLSWYIKPFFALAVAVSVLYHAGRHILEKLEGPVRLVLDARDEWLLCGRDGNRRRVRMDHASILSPGLVILRLITPEGDRRDFILTENNTGADTLRRLRVRLYYPKGNGNQDFN